jgi:hypothetical protein
MPNIALIKVGLLAGLLIALLIAGCTGSGPTEPTVKPAGQPESFKTNVLEAGATTLQRDAGPDALNIYVVGFHPLKLDTSHQLEAHHFCQQMNEDFMQCALFDGNTSAANLIGVEYIISARLFDNLPEEEKKYWHPHNGEILSGQLVAPGLPVLADKALMRSKMNSYGKTWHTWDTSRNTGKDAQLPFGAPKLAWSFNRFGEARDELIKSRDQRMGINTEARRQARQDLIPLARPQAGVDALKGKFPGPTQPIPGVVDKSSVQSMNK